MEAPQYLLAVGNRMEELSDTPIFIMGFGPDQRTEVWVHEEGDSMTEAQVLLLAAERLMDFVEHEFIDDGIEAILEEGA